MRAVGNLLGMAKKAIETVKDSPELCEHLMQVLDGLVNGDKPKTLQNPRVVKSKGRPKGALGKQKSCSQLVTGGKKKKQKALTDGSSQLQTTREEVSGHAMRRQVHRKHQQWQPGAQLERPWPQLGMCNAYVARCLTMIC